MSEKKHIDKLFKEHLKDFEVAPNDAVWERIENELNKDKRKRRVIPIWWKVAGVAAALVLMFTVSYRLLNNQENSVNTKTVNTEKTNNNSQNTDETNTSELNTSEDLEQNPIVVNEKSSEENNNSTISPNKNSTTKNNSTTNKNSTTNNTNNETGVATSEENDTNNSDSQKNKSLINNKSLQRDAVVFNEKNNLKSKTDKTNQNLNNTVVENSNGSNTQNENRINDIKKENSEIDQLIKQSKTETSTQITDSNSSEKENSETLIDTSKTKILETENAIEKAIAEADKEDSEKLKDSLATLKRWSVAPNVAPVYFNSFGNGSSIDEQFIDNTKEGEVNMSYGVKGTYAISNKFTIRAGVNKVDLGYSTNNVVAFANPNAQSTNQALANINSTDSTTTFISARNFSFASGPEILFTKEQGSISQQLGFIEVPIELEYHVLDRKFGIDVIGGFSTLFLSDNNVYSVKNNGNRTRLGEANNINDMSYSANFGVGFNYNISQQLRFNLEPTFKYQINTFNNTSGDFKPFFIGVYTGLSFKF